jgi:hypothetical protein
VKLGKTAETREMLETVYEDKAVSRAQTFWWFKCFQEVREDVEDDPNGGQLKMTSNQELVDRGHNLLTGDHWLILRMMLSELNVSKE